MLIQTQDVVKVYQKVNVRVMEVDIARKRISMSMKKGQKDSKKIASNEKPQHIKPNRKQPIITRNAKPTTNNKSLGTLAAKLTFGS